MDLITNGEENQTLKAKWDQNELNNSNQTSTLLPLQQESVFHQTETGA